MDLMRSDGSPWPRISIVTPSYNQGEFLEETIRSVLLQGYPDLEYIVIDGGSTDESVEIIRKYEPWLTYWVSERDRGQSHAINKGLERASGEVFAYLNSDDLFAPAALAVVAQAFTEQASVDVLYGRCEYIDCESRPLFSRQAHFSGFRDYLPIWRHFEHCTFLTQPEVFARTSAVADAGGIREELHSAMDLDLWLRMLYRGRSFRPLDATLAKFRLYPEQKSAGDRSEVVAVVSEYLDMADAVFTPAERRALRGELRLAEAAWLLSAGGSGAYRRAMRAYGEAFKCDPTVLARRRFWGGLSSPFRSWIGRKRVAIRGPGAGSIAATNSR